MTNLPQADHQFTMVWPEIISEKSHENSVELSLFISEKLDYFKGHFPETPILAGVVQLHWAVEYAKKAFKLTDYHVINLEVLKFQVVIMANQPMILTITQKTKEKVMFSYCSKRGQHASGRIVFGRNA